MHARCGLCSPQGILRRVYHAAGIGGGLGGAMREMVGVTFPETLTEQNSGFLHNSRRNHSGGLSRHAERF